VLCEGGSGWVGAGIGGSLAALLLAPTEKAP
jgi:hypothetical protein